MEPLYRTYITKQATGLEHYNSLPRTPAFSAYLAQTQALAHAYSGAWDLPSLLIKPVQRLMKYPLLLATILSETADAHPDKKNIEAAIVALQGVAHGVNEGRRRRDVVREVLTGTPVVAMPQKGEVKAKAMCFWESRRTMKDGTLTICLPTLPRISAKEGRA